MEKASIAQLVSRRQYSELENQANEYIESGDWKKLLSEIRRVHPKGKGRDAVVHLLELQSVGGTDSDVFKEFSSLEGTSLQQIIANSRDHAMEILKDQIQNKHTYFMDIEAMTMSPYVILVRDIIEARKRELAQLEKNPNRIDVLGTYYGFAILMIEGSRPHQNQQTSYGYRYWRRRTWIDEELTESAISAVRELTGEIAKAVDMDKRYQTLGSSRIFKDKCTKTTADILADSVRLTLYKVPGNRSGAARRLGSTGDSRALAVLHHRLSVEESRAVRISIANALGKIGHESSIEVLRERAKLQGRYLSKEGEAAVGAIGGIYSPQCRETLIDLLKEGGNTVKAASIYALSKQDTSDLVDIIAPYLLDRSRPVVRASVSALADLGSRGHAAIREKATKIIKKIGNDKPSKAALTKMMGISGVGQMKSVQKYFATRFEKLGDEIRRWNNPNRSYSYYWNRRERRAKQKLVDYLRLASTHLKPPFNNDLLKAIRAVIKIETYPTAHSILGNSQLAKSVKSRQIRDRVYQQKFLSSFR
ncbi:MAG: HEAT repeat domain-containing protein [Candidatus Thorarchaeota archaeon]